MIGFGRMAKSMAETSDRGRTQDFGPAPKKPVEVELKFQLTRERWRGLEACAPLVGKAATELHQVTTYYDT